MPDDRHWWHRSQPIPEGWHIVAQGREFNIIEKKSDSGFAERVPLRVCATDEGPESV